MASDLNDNWNLEGANLAPSIHYPNLKGTVYSPGLKPTSRFCGVRNSNKTLRKPSTTQEVVKETKTSPTMWVLSWSWDTGLAVLSWKGPWTLQRLKGIEQEQHETANVREVSKPWIFYETLDILITVLLTLRLEYRLWVGASVTWNPGLNLPKVLICLTIWIFCCFIWQNSCRRTGNHFDWAWDRGVCRWKRWE